MKEEPFGDPRVGSTLAGYRVGELIGRGGMGVVYRAEHLRLGRRAALKIVAPELAGDPAFRDRFAREARAAATLEHAHVVPVYDAGEADGELYLAMRLVEGGDLAAELEARGALDPARALELCGQMAGALDAAHAVGLIHRDVKPANVLLEDRQGYLSDFGLAFGPTSGETTTRGDLVGTIHYAAPEQIQGRTLDGRADQYALAAVLHHCLTGRPPFPRDSDAAVLRAHLRDPPPRVSELRHGLPPALDEVIARGLDKVPKRRFASCAALMGAVAEALEGFEELELEPPSVSPEGDRPGVVTLIDLPPIKATWDRRAQVLLAAVDAQTRALARVALAGRCEIREVDDDEDSERVIAAAKEQSPDLLVLDWNAGGQGAAAIVAALRDDPALGELKVLLTVEWTLAASPDVRAAGADATLEKPFSPLQLQVKLRRLLGAGVGHQ